MHALFGIGWTQHWGTQGSCDKDVYAIFHPLLEVTSLKKKHVCLKDSSAEGTCLSLIKGHVRYTLPRQHSMMLNSVKVHILMVFQWSNSYSAFFDSYDM